MRRFFGKSILLLFKFPDFTNQDQLAMVQNELAALTMVEMKKRDMKVINNTIIMVNGFN